jgi:hypothetical protein
VLEIWWWWRKIAATWTIRRGVFVFVKGWIDMETKAKCSSSLN